MTFRSTLAFAAVAFVGCEKQRRPVESYVCQASGMVKLDDVPLRGGMVTFVPLISESVGGHPGIASIDAEGRFRLGNAEHGRMTPLMPGEYAVTVVAHDIDRSRGKPSPRLAIPARYADFKATPLRVTVKPGENDVELRLVR